MAELFIFIISALPIGEKEISARIWAGPTPVSENPGFTICLCARCRSYIAGQGCCHCA